MNDTRKTVNDWFSANVMPNLPGWTCITGDEANPEILNSYIGLNWIAGRKSGMRQNSSTRLLQLEVFVSDQDTNRAEDACVAIQTALNLNSGTNPILSIPKMGYTGDPLNPTITEKPTVIIIRRLGEIPFGESGTAPSPDSRLYILTLEIDYIPG